MKIIEVENYEDMSRRAADIIKGVVNSKPDAVLGFATGSTPEGVYKCLIEDNKKVLDMCASNKMYTIKSDLVINYKNTFDTIKNRIDKGSIIVFDVNNNTIDELSKALLFLNSKGYNYNLLSDHLSEKGCN
jgi:hypothetical protein